MGSDLARRARFLDARDACTDGVCVPLASVNSSECFSAAHDGGSYDCGGVPMIPVQPATLQKITAGHLQRQAMLYVRQSTLHQVLENTESTARQYALRERAIALGWPAKQIVVIDQDLGQSGASAVDREGFQRLVAEVGLSHVGLVMGLEVSRLARSSLDWHHLLEICAMTGTLILDEDGLYDPATFNDRLLLGLKGTMSEAELHVLRARLRGGILNKAQRAALKLPLPMGLAYAEDDTVILDPDAQIQQAISMLFATFKRTGSATATVKYFRTQGLLFPRHVRIGPHAGVVHWGPLLHSTTLKVLRNPRYAGAFCYGRTRTSKRLDGKQRTQVVPQQEWPFLFKEAHAGYITWEEYEANLEQLQQNRPAYGEDRRHGPAREGPALLQGLVICGRCGQRMTLRYYERKKGTRLYPEYLCQREQIEQAGETLCQQVLGAGLDAAISELLLAQLTPLAIDTTMQVYEELHLQAQEAQRLRDQQVERARYAAELAQRRFLRVDPENRLVADVLEADWNARLRELAQVQEEAKLQNEAEQRKLSALERQAIADLIDDFPRVWKDERTSDRDRKRMVRLLVEDVTVLKKEEMITAQVRFKGGATQTITMAVSHGRRSAPQVIELMDQLLDDFTDAEVAEQLNQRGWCTSGGKPFHARRVLSLRRDYHLKDHGTRLRERGLLSADEAAKAYGVCRQTIMEWGRAGLLPTYRTNDRGMVVFPPPDEHAPQKNTRKYQKTPSSYERSTVCN
jgi:DNA invertase Pin-like site-specific DNA recombinase